MIVFFIPSTTEGAITRQAVVLLDDTRSDDTFSPGTIYSLTVQAAGRANVLLEGKPLVFSLNYSVLFKHSALKLEDAIKTFSQITVSNAPPALSNLIKVTQLAAQQSVMSLQSAANMVIEAQKIFPWAVVFFPPANMSIFPGASSSIESYVTKVLVVYDTEYNMESSRVGSSLRIKLGSFDSIVMRLKFDFLVEKTTPFVAQITAKVKDAGYTVEADAAISAALPVIEKHYPPAPMNSVLYQIAKDNGCWISIDTTAKKITVKSLSSNNPPEPDALNTPKFCFRGKAKGAFLIGNFGIQDYVTVRVESELVPVELFDTVQLFNDTGDDALFQNFTASTGIDRKAYNFYVLEYAMMQDRNKTTLEFIGTNNWILSNFRLSYFFENAIFTASKEALQ